jgi:hypothetical protein
MGFLYKKKVTVGIATWEPRIPTIGETLNSLVNQADKIHIFLNGYKSVPENVPKFNNVYYHTDSGNDYKSNSKFKFQKIAKVGYYFTCDDDLIYPNDYIEKSINFEKNNPGYIYTYHGAILKKEYSNWKEDSILDHFRKETKEMKIVHMGGSGVMFWNLDFIKIPMYIFNDNNLDDEFYLSKWTFHKNIKILSAPKQQNWIRLSNANQDVSIYNRDFIVKRNNLILSENLHSISLI